MQKICWCRKFTVQKDTSTVRFLAKDWFEQKIHLCKRSFCVKAKRILLEKLLEERTMAAGEFLMWTNWGEHLFLPTICCSLPTTGCPKKVTNGMLLEPLCTGSITSSQQPVCLEKMFTGRFLLRQSRIKCSQVMSMGKFGPTALNFGQDLFLLFTFLGHPVIVVVFLLFCGSVPIMTNWGKHLAQQIMVFCCANQNFELWYVTKPFSHWPHTFQMSACDQI